jgi:hypothetical protein
VDNVALPYVQEEAFPELVKPVPVPEPAKIRRHNYKIIEALEAELADIRRNPVYRVLVWLKILPKGGKK